MWLGCCYSADGRCRCRFVADRCSFAARRRRFEPRVGLVGRRWTPSGARPAAMSSASLLRAISRLRSWERCSEAVTVIRPVMRRRPRRMASVVRSPSESAAESAIFQESSTRLSEVFTCCPPGPDERENRHRSSDAGIVSAGETSRSMQQASHSLRPNVAFVTTPSLPRLTRCASERRHLRIHCPIQPREDRLQTFGIEMYARLVVSVPW